MDNVIYCPGCGSIRELVVQAMLLQCCPDAMSRMTTSREIAEQAQVGFKLDLEAYRVGTIHGEAHEKARKKAVERCPTPDVIVLPFCPAGEIKTALNIAYGRVGMKSPKMTKTGLEFLVKILEDSLGLVEKPQTPLVWPITSSDKWSNACQYVSPVNTCTREGKRGFNCCDMVCPLGFDRKTPVVWEIKQKDPQFPECNNTSNCCTFRINNPAYLNGIKCGCPDSELNRTHSCSKLHCAIKVIIPV